MTRFALIASKMLVLTALFSHPALLANQEFASVEAPEAIKLPPAEGSDEPLLLEEEYIPPTALPSSETVSPHEENSDVEFGETLVEGHSGSAPSSSTSGYIWLAGIFAILLTAIYLLL